MAQVAVVGGGVSGLAAALHLADAGHRAVVLEGSPRVGGKLRTGTVAGRAVDVGAESLLWRRPEPRALLGRLGLSPQHPSAAGAAVWSRGELHPLPAGTLMGVPADPDRLAGLLTAPEVARARDERRICVPEGRDLALGELVAQALGDAVVDRLVEPLLGGVYAGRARLLSAAACLPALHAAAVDGIPLTAAVARATAPVAGTRPGGGPVFASLAGGLGTLPAAMAAAVAAAGGQVRTGAPVRSLAPMPGGWRLGVGDGPQATTLDVDGVVLAVAAGPAAGLLEAVAPAAAARLAGVEHASVALVTLALDAAGAPERLLASTGFLVPPVDGRRIKAATFSSTKWPWLARRDPDLVVLRASFGRHGQDTDLSRPDAELVQDALADLGEALGQPVPRPLDAVVQRWENGLPQYLVGHQQRLAAIAEEIDPLPGLALAGALHEGVGIPACLGSGARAADRVLNDLTTR